VFLKFLQQLVKYFTSTAMSIISNSPYKVTFYLILRKSIFHNRPLAESRVTLALRPLDNAARSAVLGLAIKESLCLRRGLALYQGLKTTAAMKKRKMVTGVQNCISGSIRTRERGLMSNVLTYHHTTTDSGNTAETVMAT
jgi:hypothetical protein